MDIDPLPACEPLFMALQAIITSINVHPFGVGQILALVLAVLCLFISAFISGSEISYFSLTPQQCEDLDDTPSGPRIRRLLAKPERLLATILIANNLVNVTIVVLINFAIGPVFDSMHPVLSFLLQTVILTFLILLFGEIVPKLYANSSPDKWACAAATPLNALYTLFAPLARMLVSSTSIMHHVVSKQDRMISPDELSQALEVTDVKATDQKQMLQGILRFGDTNASEIMTPRIDVTDIEMNSTFDQVMAIVLESGYSRLPVYEGTQDNIRGILYARDLLPYIGKQTDDFKWQSLLREPYYVPESRMIDDLLEDFRKRKIHLAIVVDEYGGTQGIVTLEDVLEEIVGDINDEYDEEDATYKRLSDNTFNFEGRTLLTDFFRVTGLDEKDYEDVTDDVETLAGMLLAIKGDFPKEKEPMVYGRCRFLVLDVTDHRITSVRVMIMPEDEKQ